MSDAELTLSRLEELFGPCDKKNGNEYIWQCPFCAREGHDQHKDNFKFNIGKNKFSCFADDYHTKEVSKAIREKFYTNKRWKKGTQPDTIPIEQAPQEILDYWEARKITVSTLKHFEVKWDKAYQSICIPTPIFKNKYKPLFGDEFFNGKVNFSNNTTYSPDKAYQGQKKFLYLEGIPDIWAIHSNFPDEFFKEFYVSGTVHGCTHIPTAWKDPKFWNNFDEIYLCGDADTPGQKAVRALKKTIDKDDKTKILELPFTHKRMVNGVEAHYTSTDFNDWIIEGGTFEQFMEIIQEGSRENEELKGYAIECLKDPNYLDKVLREIEVFGVVGEELNKLQIYLEDISRLSRSKSGGISSKAVAPTAVGKSTLYKVIGQNFFKEDFEVVTDRSAKVLYRKGRNALKHKILMTEEDYQRKETPEQAEKSYQLRVAKTEGALIYDVLEDKKGGGKEPKKYILDGPFVFQDCATKSTFKDEDINRDTVHHFDESIAHTEEILQAQKESESFFDLGLESQKEVIIQKHIAIQRILKKNIPDKIVIPDAIKIKFPALFHRSRRDLPRFMKYVKAHANLHQFQRPKMTGFEYLKNHNLKTIKNYVNKVMTQSNLNLAKWTQSKSTLRLNLQEINDVEAYISQIRHFTQNEPKLPPECLEIAEFINEVASKATLKEALEVDAKSQSRESYFFKKNFLENLKNCKMVLVALQDDVIAIQNIIGENLAEEYHTLDKALSERYKLLEAEFRIDREFKSKEAAKILGTSNNFARDTLKQLQESDLCEIFEGNRPYRYKLKPMTSKLSPIEKIGISDEDKTDNNMYIPRKVTQSKNHFASSPEDTEELARKTPSEKKALTLQSKALCVLTFEENDENAQEALVNKKNKTDVKKEGKSLIEGQQEGDSEKEENSIKQPLNKADNNSQDSQKSRSEFLTDDEDEGWENPF